MKIFFLFEVLEFNSTKKNLFSFFYSSHNEKTLCLLQSWCFCVTSCYVGKPEIGSFRRWSFKRFSKVTENLLACDIFMSREKLSHHDFPHLSFYTLIIKYSSPSFLVVIKESLMSRLIINLFFIFPLQFFFFHNKYLFFIVVQYVLFENILKLFFVLFFWFSFIFIISLHGLVF